jgi:hypothetical protein
MPASRFAPRVLLAAAVAGLLALSPGCGKKDNRLDVHPARGQVLVGEKPAKGVHVSLWPVSAEGRDAYCPHGETDENGNFTLSTYETGDGAPAGDYKVTAEWPVKFNAISNRWEGDKLRGKFTKQQSSQIQVTIRPGPNELPPIKLTE